MREHIYEFLKASGAQVVQTKYLEAERVVANLAAAGLYPSAELTLDSNYQICDGIAFVQIGNGGLANDYKVAIRNNNGKVIEEIGIGAVGTTNADGSAPDTRFVDVLFDSQSGNKVFLEVTTPAATSAELKVKAIFRQRKLSRKVSIPQL